MLTGYSGDGIDYIRGSDGNDMIYGEGGDDDLLGDNGDDTLYGGAGNDKLSGHNDNDTLYGGTGNDNLSGGNGNDHLYGDDGSDILNGGDGNDDLYGGLGTDTLTGAAGDDTYYLMIGEGGDTITESTYSGTDTIRFMGVNASDMKVWSDSAYFYIGFTGYSGYAARLTHSISSFSSDIGNRIEQLVFDDNTVISLTGDLVLYGTDNGETINGSIGNDTIYGYAGDDFLYGGAGIDSLYGGDGIDYIRGSDGNDMIYGEGGDDDLLGDNGDDTLYGGAGNDKLSGHNDNDTLYGGTGNDNLSGGNGNDHLYGDDGSDTLIGAAGDDVYYITLGEGADIITETSNNGTDTIRFMGVNASDMKVWSDSAYFYIGFTGHSGYVARLTHTVNATLFHSDIGSRIEQLVFDDNTVIALTGNLILHDTDDAHTVNGSVYNDIIYGNGGNDILYGAAGNDILYGGLGNDTLRGNQGDDLYVFESGIDTYLEQLSGNDIVWITNNVSIEDISFSNLGSYDTKIIVFAGIDEIILDKHRHSGTQYHFESLRFDDGFETNLLTDYQNWNWGTTGADTLTGNGNNNMISGNDGNDTITAGDGDDDIHGGSGNDTLYGGIGSDFLHGGEGNDLLYGGDGADILYGGNGADTFAFLNGDTGMDAVRNFDLTENDVLDISDLLGAYDPMSDIISDFVQITDNGVDSFLAIDANGGADNFVQIAQLNNITGLTDEAALVNSGNLIVV